MDNTIEQLDQMPQRWCCTPPRAACGGIFRNKEAMQATELANSKNWRNLWLETYFMLVLLAFKSVNLMHWTIRIKWENCIESTKAMDFLVTHIIYRKDNSCGGRHVSKSS
ncbi:hypothetical protein MTR_2g010070 [Medicago truncatula]|uniref:Uncharacterized protein n=1 Tax=Medicago truncatula TaxID=3880 RepID=G7ISA0_MEDTR|nr:hypothetical protein MTR_2g010070 [Medicago truncatula]